MKKEMEDPEKNYQNKKKNKTKTNKNAITIVVFMSKEIYRKVWEEVKLTAENEMLFYLPRTMEK